MTTDPEVLVESHASRNASPLETVVDIWPRGYSVDEILDDFRVFSGSTLDAFLNWEANLARDVAAGLERLAS